MLEGRRRWGLSGRIRSAALRPVDQPVASKRSVARPASTCSCSRKESQLAERFPAGPRAALPWTFIRILLAWPSTTPIFLEGRMPPGRAQGVCHLEPVPLAVKDPDRHSKRRTGPTSGEKCYSDARARLRTPRCRRPSHRPPPAIWGRWLTVLAVLPNPFFRFPDHPFEALELGRFRN